MTYKSIQFWMKQIPGTEAVTGRSKTFSSNCLVSQPNRLCFHWQSAPHWHNCHFSTRRFWICMIQNLYVNSLYPEGNTISSVFWSQDVELLQSYNCIYWFYIFQFEKLKYWSVHYKKTLKWWRFIKNEITCMFASFINSELTVNNANGTFS